MPILVAGTPGSGKTTLAQYAVSIGDERFFDADDIDKLCEWREFKTGKVLGYVKDYRRTGLNEWYEKYGWYWRKSSLGKFLQKHHEAILCGSAENIADFYGLFDKIVILKKTEDELLANLDSPDRINPFGKTPEQRKGLMKWQYFLIDKARVFEPFILKGNEIRDTYEAITRLARHDN